MSLTYRASHRHDVWVTLTDAEYADAADHGRSLYAESQAAHQAGQMHDRRAGVKDGLTGEWAQIIGAVAECAGAKACGLPWPKRRGNFKGADLAHNIDVRDHTGDWYGCRVSPRDHPSRRILMVIILKGQERGRYRIPGWINARYGQRPEWLQDFNRRQQPIHAAPQEELCPLDLLLALIAMEQAHERRRLLYPHGGADSLPARQRLSEAASEDRRDAGDRPLGR